MSNQQIKQAQKIQPFAKVAKRPGIATELDTDGSIEQLESAVLGGVLNYQDMAASVIAEIKQLPLWFYLKHQYIYNAMYELVNQSSPVDMVLLSQQLKKQGQLEDVGGPAYLTTMLSNALKDNIKKNSLREYIHHLKIYYSRRVMNETAKTVLRQTEDMKISPLKAMQLASETMNKTQTLILDITMESNIEMLDKHADAVEQYIEGNSKPKLYPTGLVDGLIEGLSRQKVILTAARPNHGKTSVLVSIAYNMLKCGMRVAYFNVADGNSQDVLSRFISIESNLPLSEVSRFEVKSEDHSRYLEAVAKLSKLPLFVRSVKGMTLPQMNADAQSIKYRYGLDLVVVDYIQRINLENHPDAPKDMVAKYEYISASIVKMAETLDVPFLVGAQINRSADGKMPTASQIKGSGSFEENSDIVLLVHYPYRDDPDFSEKQLIQIKVGKNKVNNGFGLDNFRIDPSTTYVHKL